MRLPPDVLLRMNVTSERKLYVGLHQANAQAPVAVGLLKLVRSGNIESGEYAYGRQYLDAPAAIALNPDHLPLTPEVRVLPPQRIREGGALPLTFRDALPDSWGRKVLESQHGGPLNDIDVLLRTNQDRVGAMLFSEALPILNEDDDTEPTTIEALAEAVRRLEFDMEIPQHMRKLLRRGGSLGGARPKSSFIHAQQKWLAKFPAVDDRHDVELLEHAVLRLAALCGIEVSPSQLVPIQHGHAILIKRFDRQGEIDGETRLHYLSASALLNVSYESGSGSYVELAQVIRRISSQPQHDLNQLYRRMIFNIIIDNTDDHVKNHGMLHVGHGQYRLAPAFDIEMQLRNLGQQELAIMPGHSAMQAAPAFGLSEQDAQQSIEKIQALVDNQLVSITAALGAAQGLQSKIQQCLRRQYELTHDMP